MDTARTIEPLDFFSWDALKAGWYLAWRLFLYLFPIPFVAGVLAGALGVVFPPIIVLIVLGAVPGFIVVWVKVTNRIARQWAAKYGQRLTEGVFLEILWRLIVVWILSTVANAIVNVPVILLLRDAAIAGVVGAIMVVVSVIVGILGDGWAMSAAVAKKLGAGAPMAAAMAAPPMAAASGAPGAMAAAMSAPPPPRPAPGERMQCPKCGLNETERGAVIGWYCKVCGWREGRR